MASLQTQSTEFDLVIRARRAILDHGAGAGVDAAEIGVRDGRFAAIRPWGSGLPGRDSIDVPDDHVLIPGLVDTHVHVNEPGRTEWEGFASATKAAAAGAVTTIIDMPLNSIPPTVDTPALLIKRAAAAGKTFVDVGFWGGAVPGNTAALAPLHDAGVFGFKCFLLHSGVDEFGYLSVAELEQDMTALAAFDGLMIVHAENAEAIATAPVPSGTRYADFLASRPRGAENTAIADVIDCARRTGARAHILHLSSSDALGMIADAKADGIRLTVETCPHYLTLLAEDIPDGATAFKCCPPIREEANRDALWQGLIDGTIDCIVSDHSPSTVALKDPDGGDFGVAWGGVASLQLGLPLIWTQARERGVPLTDVIGWMSRNPADIARVANKGAIAVGNDADFAVFDPDTQWTVRATELHHRNPVSPYDGTTLTGVVRGTWVRGSEVDFAVARGEVLTH